MDLDTLLRETARVPDPTLRTLMTGRAALDAATVTPARRIAAVRRIRSRRARRVALTAIIASAASLALVIGPTLDLRGSRPAATASAAEVLNRAAAAAGAQPGGWANATYWHAVSEYRQGSEGVRPREIWIGHRDPGVLRDPGVSGGYISLDVATFPAGARSLSWDELYALPTAAGALERELRAGIGGAGSDDDTELFVIVGDLLRETPASPALRKALWEVAARVPGVELLGPTTDSAGRPGVAVGRGGQRYILDPDDGRLLEEYSTPMWSGATPTDPAAVPGPYPAQAVAPGPEYRSTYLEQGPADSAPAT